MEYLSQKAVLQYILKSVLSLMVESVKVSKWREELTVLKTIDYTTFIGFNLHFFT